MLGRRENRDGKVGGSCTEMLGMNPGRLQTGLDILWPDYQDRTPGFWNLPGDPMHKLKTWKKEAHLNDVDMSQRLPVLNQCSRVMRGTAAGLVNGMHRAALGCADGPSFLLISILSCMLRKKYITSPLNSFM